jgi:hypothetical protein
MPHACECPPPTPPVAPRLLRLEPERKGVAEGRKLVWGCICEQQRKGLAPLMQRALLKKVLLVIKLVPVNKFFLLVQLLLVDEVLLPRATCDSVEEAREGGLSPGKVRGLHARDKLWPARNRKHQRIRLCVRE